MPKFQCHRRECNRIRSEFSIFMNRKIPPVYQGNRFCSESCLRAHFKHEISEKWTLLQMERRRPIPRPRLGTILMQTAGITREQIEHAVRLQAETRAGRIGEWLMRLGYVEERQITAALGRQYGLPVINLDKSDTNGEGVRMVLGMVARCSGVIPVGFEDSRSSLRVAVSAPVDFNSQQAIRRMTRKGIVAYVGDQSAIERLLQQWYPPEELELSDVPGYSSLGELIEIGNELISSAIAARAESIQAELVQEFFWVRFVCSTGSHHHFFRCVSVPVEQPVRQNRNFPVPGQNLPAYETKLDAAMLKMNDEGRRKRLA